MCAGFRVGERARDWWRRWASDSTYKVGLELYGRRGMPFVKNSSGGARTFSWT